MASKTQLAVNKYKIRYTDYQKKDKNGKPLRTGFTFHGNSSEAEKERLEWEKMEKKMKQGFKFERTNREVTLATLYDWFFNGNAKPPIGLKWKNLKREKPIKPKTIENYECAFTNFCDAFGSNTPIENLDSTEYRMFFANRKLSGLNVDIRAMRSIINVAIEHKDRIVKEMPKELFMFTVTKNDPYYLEINQVRKILNTPMDESTYDLFNIYLYTGCRLMGINTLTWDRVDFKKKTITVIEKADKKRTIFVPDNVIQILLKWSSRPKPTNISDRTIMKKMKKLSIASGVPFTCRILRSTCGSFMLSSGCSIEQVAEHLGHEDIQTTRRWYARLIKDQREAAMLKFSDFVSNMVQEPVSPYITVRS